VNPGQFRRPKGIAVDQENVVYVADSDFNNVQMFDSQGQPLLAVGQHGERPGEMLLPAGVAASPAQRRIYVAEQLTRRVQVFERVGAPAGH
jgi:DNA-binding beta-propeller fold protein YncE